MNIFKIGDKVKFDNTNGDAYGLKHDHIMNAKTYPYLTVKKALYSRAEAPTPQVWFLEVTGYWNPSWFKKVNNQLEFNFNAQI